MTELQLGSGRRAGSGFRRNLIVCSGSLLAAILLTGQAVAGQTAAASSTAEEPDLTSLPMEQLLDIVVTAQKREENLQAVPIAISAFTAETLRTKDVEDVAELGRSTPNISFGAGAPFSGSTSVLSAFIRGIGQDDFAFNLDPGVGVYLDGVYLARAVGANVDLLDIDRVEILKGPQGTLFGRNTIGGAVSIVTRDPGSTYGATAEVTTGSFDRLDVKGSIDLPFSARLRSSLAFSMKSRAGYLKRIPFPAPVAGVSGIADCDALQAPGTPCTYVVDPPGAFVQAGSQTSGREGGQKQWNLRAKLVWEASDRVKATLTGDFERIDQPAMANTLLGTATAPTDAFGFFYNLCIGTPAPVLAKLGFGLVCGPRGVVGSPIGGVNVDGDPNNNRLPYDKRFVTGDIDTSYATGLSFSKLTDWGVAATLDVTLSNVLALKSITALRGLSWSSGTDLDGSPNAMLELSFRMPQHQISEELQLTGTGLGDRLRYVVGGYFFREAGSLDDFVIYPAGLLQILGPNDLSTRTWAGYANLNFRLTERLSITLGGRFTWEDKTLEGGQTDLNAFVYKIAGCYPPDAPSPVPGRTCQQLLGFPVPGEPLRYFPAGINRQSFKVFTPKLGAELRVSDHVTAYGSYSQGFKSGGWTTRLSDPISDAAFTEFGPERAETYELGLKSEFVNRRVRLNVAAFYSRYKGIQLNVLEGVSPTLRNAGEAEIYGGEAELQALVTRAFSLDASVGYLYDRYVKLAPNVVGITLANKLAKTPSFRFDLAPQYVVDLPNRGALVLNADFTHTSSLFNDAENTPLFRRPATNILGASVAYREPGRRWELSAGGTNILNDRYIVTGLNQVAGGELYATYSAPAEWYIRLRASF